MLSRPIEIWTRYRYADRRQLPLFPDWERARWLMPMPSVGAALGLIALFAMGASWTAGPEPVIARAEPVEEIEEVEAPEGRKLVEALGVEQDTGVGNVPRATGLGSLYEPVLGECMQEHDAPRPLRT